MTDESEDEWPFGAEGKRVELFFTEDDNPVFVQIMYEMKDLKEYCELCMNATLSRWGDLNEELEKYKKDQSDNKAPERTAQLEDWIFETQFEHDLWWRNLDFVAPATCLLLLAIFLEKSLKNIAIAYTPNGKKMPRIPNNLGKPNGYMAYLREKCGFQFEQPASTASMLDHCRSVRNSFAHGDWEDIKSAIGEINLREAFSVVTALLESIELASYSLPKSIDSD